MSSSIVDRNRAATKEHYDTLEQEQEQLSEAAAFLAQPENEKLSAGMRESLQALQKSLNCALCQSVTVRPVTLSCAHTFCCSCIDVYAENNWNCPSKCWLLALALAQVDQERVESQAVFNSTLSFVFLLLSAKRLQCSICHEIW